MPADGASLQPAATPSPSASSTASKPKKPPACDRCKAKRVLCHPNPAGCPRCVEKGVDCVGFLLTLVEPMH
ncbi:RHTO0S11e00892g1_1 [Rhodotorula toruloides]|uniref:RHTO0S11e00892g1_1 n=1 Tax=Rhodotorula toruloides TaxID=5286 RepID=A0A061B6A3_RHOTO|nr:RHTO0S11e00892g1_1 [Rhodotorula toruloides]